MGFLDETEKELLCKSCGVKETITVVDKGSMWDGSFWTVPNSQHFDIDWKGGGRLEPQIVKAVCRSCGIIVIP